MLTLTQGSDLPIISNEYDSGQIISQTLATGEKFLYHYSSEPEGRRNVMLPDLITDPRGLVTFFLYNSGGYIQSLPQRGERQEPGPQQKLPELLGKGSALCLRHSLPPADRARPYKRRPVILLAVAHRQRIAVCQVIRDIPVIEKRNKRPFLGQAHVKSLIFLETMGKQ
jgi:hypothetical protein